MHVNGFVYLFVPAVHTLEATAFCRLVAVNKA